MSGRLVPKTGPPPPSSATSLPGPVWLSAARAPAWWRWPAALVLAVLTFPLYSLVPAAGLDASWRAGLALAQAQGLHFGRDIVFTYGPLGFLAEQPLFVVWSAVAGLAFYVVLQVLLCRTLLYVMRELPAPIAVVVAYVVAAAAVPTAELGLMIVLALTLSTLLDTEQYAPRWLPAAAGGAAAILLLIKPNVGVVALLLATIAVGLRSLRLFRAFTELAGSFVVVFGVAWLATGNTVGGIVPWLRASAQFVAGYSAGMALDDPIQHHELVRAGLLVVAVSVLLWRVAAGRPRVRQAGLALAWSIGAFAMFKEGFVRHDGYVTIFCAAVAATAVARSGSVMRFVAAGIAVLASIWSLSAAQLPASGLLDYTTRVDGAVAELKLVVDAGDRGAAVSLARASMLRNLRLPPKVIHDLRAHTVDVQPSETSAVWTLGLRWRPEPVFQSYAVLTPALDRLNADFLASSRAPERVLRLYPLLDIDGRNAVFDAPDAFLALVCNYRETFAGRGAEVLARATNRCGAPRRLSGGPVQAGQLVRVPRAGPDELVYARIRIPRSFTERLRELVWRPAVPPAIDLDGAPFRLVAATASGPLLMRMPASAGFPPSGLRETQVDTLRLTDVPSPVQVDFYAVRVG